MSSIVRDEVERLNANLDSLKAETSTVARDFDWQKERSTTRVVEHNRQISSILNSRLLRMYNEIPNDRVEHIPFEDANLITNIAIVNTIDKVLRIFRYKDDGDEYYKKVDRLMKVAEEKIHTVDASTNQSDPSQVLLAKLDSAKESIEAARVRLRDFHDIVMKEIPKV